MFLFLFHILKQIFCFTGSYSNDVFLKPLSSSEEEKYIALKMSGDGEARNKLIEHNLRLVAHIAKKYDSKYTDMDDLISIGTIGLIKGVDTFSPNKNVKITTYCARCIENATVTSKNFLVELMHYLNELKLLYVNNPYVLELNTNYVRKYVQ